MIMDVNLKLSEKDKKAIKKSVGSSLLAGVGTGLVSRELTKQNLGVSSKVDPRSILPFANNSRISEAVKEAAKSGESASEALSRVKMSPEDLKELDKMTLAGGAAGTLGTLAALSLMHGFGKIKKSYDKRAAERYNVDSAKNLALREAGFPSEDEDYYGKSTEIVSVLGR